MFSNKQPRAKEAKEAQVFLVTINVQVWYYLLSSLVSENMGAGALLLALERSGQRSISLLFLWCGDGLGFDCIHTYDFSFPSLYFCEMHY
jgi:hypothetical protein